MNRVQNLLLRTVADQPTDYWHLLVASGTQYGTFLEALRHLLSTGLIAHQDALYSLTSKGKEVVTQTALAAPLLTKEGLDTLKEIAQGRPERKDELDQSLAPIEVILNRLAILHEHGDLHQTRIALLGDDDCMGAALALTGMAKEVVVLEYDPEICAHYASYNLPHLTLHEHNLCHPVPKSVEGTCDIFFTDPCPSLEMLKVFLSRGLETLAGEKCAGYTAMSQTEASPKKWYVLQKLLLEAGCAITEMRQNVNTYDLEGDWLFDTRWNVIEEAPYPPPKPTLHWYCSALMRIETVRAPTPFIEGAIAWDLGLYKDPEVILTEKEKALYC